MSTVGQIEKRTQARVVSLFRKRLNYDYLGDRTALDNRNIELAHRCEPAQTTLRPQTCSGTRSCISANRNSASGLMLPLTLASSSADI